MSMRSPLFGDAPIPEETARVAHAAFPKGNLYLLLRDHFGMLFDNHHFAHLFSFQGKPALAPARLALVSIFQFLEDLSDREAADAVRDRISWKYALGLPLDDPGFDFSVLSEFRSRLIRDDPDALLLDAVLEVAQEAGLLKAGGNQRTDSTHVLAAIRQLYRLETIGETLRHALNRLATLAPSWLLAHVTPEWAERYGTRIEQYRLPKDDAGREALALQFAQDGFSLLSAVDAPDAPAQVRELPALVTLRQMWVQQYYLCSIPGLTQLSWRGSEDLPSSSKRIASPYDPEARFATKRETQWLGYTVHLTETCDQVPRIHAALKERGVLPDEHLMDQGYVDAKVLVTSKEEVGVTIVGPAAADHSWQARTEGGLVAGQFGVEWESKQVSCPEGKVSRVWREGKSARGEAVIKVEFSATDCGGCGRQEQCTRAKESGRRLTLRPQEQHIALERQREWQETEEFKERYKRRSGVEGTFEQGKRHSDLRQARYIGVGKVHLQHVLTAVALNVLRLIAWLVEVPRAATRVSAFAALMAGSS
jgi:transposase